MHFEIINQPTVNGHQSSFSLVNAVLLLAIFYFHPLWLIVNFPVVQ